MKLNIKILNSFSAKSIGANYKKENSDITYKTTHVSAVVVNTTKRKLKRIRVV